MLRWAVASFQHPEAGAGLIALRITQARPEREFKPCLVSRWRCWHQLARRTETLLSPIVVGEGRTGQRHRPQHTRGGCVTDQLFEAPEDGKRLIRVATQRCRPHQLVDRLGAAKLERQLRPPQQPVPLAASVNGQLRRPLQSFLGQVRYPVRGGAIRAGIERRSQFLVGP